MYSTEEIEVLKKVTFPVAFQGTPFVWGRGAFNVGYNEDEPNYSLGCCEVVPGTMTPTGCTLRTFVYRYHLGFFGTIAWFPVDPTGVEFAFTALGQLQTTDAGDEGDIASSGVRFSVENPMHREGSLFVSVPEGMHSALRVYNVAGARVATLHQGNLGVGGHEFRWSGLGTRGHPLPSGLYLVKLETPARTITRKLVVVRSRRRSVGRAKPTLSSPGERQGSM